MTRTKTEINIALVNGLSRNIKLHNERTNETTLQGPSVHLRVPFAGLRGPFVGPGDPICLEGCVLAGEPLVSLREPTIDLRHPRLVVLCRPERTLFRSERAFFGPRGVGLIGPCVGMRVCFVDLEVTPFGLACPVLV